MVVDRAEKDRFPEVRWGQLAERSGKAARGEAVVAALLGGAGRMPAVLGALWQIEEGEEQPLRALEQTEREAVPRDDQEPGALAGFGDLRGDRALPGGFAVQERAD